MANGVAWDPNIDDHTLPFSLYLGAKPAWWGDDVPWPAIGPDLSPISIARRHRRGRPNMHRSCDPGVTSGRPVATLTS